MAEPTAEATKLRRFPEPGAAGLPSPLPQYPTLPPAADTPIVAAEIIARGRDFLWQQIARPYLQPLLAGIPQPTAEILQQASQQVAGQVNPQLDVMMQSVYASPDGNIVVYAADPRLAKRIGLEAARLRETLTEEWFGKGERLPPWRPPLILGVRTGDLGAGGATSFTALGRDKIDLVGSYLQGPEARVMDSVLPHEMTHAVLATRFGCTLPRWADEGASTVMEHSTERDKQRLNLIEFLKTKRGIAFSDMFQMTAYPADILPLYSQGYSLANFLIRSGERIEQHEADNNLDGERLSGKQRFARYLQQGMDSKDWAAATKQYYGFPDLGQLQNAWLDWVRKGSTQSVAATELFALSGGSFESPGVQSDNFVVRAPTQAMAHRAAAEAEKLRHDIATTWFGAPLPRWSAPCSIDFQAGNNLPGYGVTHRQVENGEVFNWHMTLQGSESAILQSYLPRQITNAVLTSHFRDSPPLWASVGAAHFAGPPAERQNLGQTLVQALQTQRGIPFSELVSARQFPADEAAFRAEAFSLTRYLVELRGERAFIDFVTDGRQEATKASWSRAAKTHFGFENLASLQEHWLEWVKTGGRNKTAKSD